MARLAELEQRRTALLKQSVELRDECRARFVALSPAGRALESAQGLLARLKRVPLKLLVTVARSGIRETLTNDARRATLIAGASTAAIALARRYRRWRRSRADRAADGERDDGVTDQARQVTERLANERRVTDGSGAGEGS